jgi:hypothetical protein
MICVVPVQTPEKFTDTAQRRQAALYLMLKGIVRISLPNRGGAALTGNFFSLCNYVQNLTSSFALLIVTIVMNSAGCPGTFSH